jgi:hypothetical protein
MRNPFKRKKLFSEDELKKVRDMTRRQATIFTEKKFLSSEKRFARNCIFFQMWFICLGLWGGLYNGISSSLFINCCVSILYGISCIVFCLKYKHKYKIIRELEVEEIPWWEAKEWGGYK